eukprot:TRINITY_DN17530_c0_g1_i1.p1 TRINITY_DN17530_c0_g1~~TRINITY_DN17530_c0_g1_i1.p1  ORF type:complete len:634 (+),score=99.50 TRINITY_DN17530_c0_g1_i1:228-2129(+)
MPREVIHVDTDTTDSSGSDADTGSTVSDKRLPASKRRTRRIVQIAGVTLAVGLVAVGVVLAVPDTRHQLEDYMDGSAADDRTQEAPAKPKMADDDCCKEEKAKCQACQVGETMEEFCYARQHASKLPSGCETIIKETKCCEEATAICDACRKGETFDQYCASDAEKMTGCACDHIEENTDYPGGDLFATHTATPEACCQKCRDEPRCTAWTHNIYSKLCNLKSPVQVKRNPGIKGRTSGLPHANLAIHQIKPIQGICMQTLTPPSEDADADAEAAPTALTLEMNRCDNTGNTAEQHFHYDRFNGFIRSVMYQEVCLSAELEQNGVVSFVTCNATAPEQKWGYFFNNTIRNEETNLCLSAPHMDQQGSHVFVMPCDVDDVNQQWDIWYITPVDPATLDPPPARTSRNHSLFCVASMLPWGGELLLLKMQYRQKVSLFACEGHDVYSNVIVDLGGVSTRMIYTDLHCGYGQTVFNTRVFYHFWQQLTKDGRYLDYTWTVKLDPDAVFFPNRLHDVVRGHDHDAANEKNGMFLNNCIYGMHGPVEVVSRRALETYTSKSDLCEQIARYAPQEDVWLRACMVRLGVFEKAQFDLLAEDHCHSPRWWTCQEGYVAFHPFKQVDGYEGCLERAAKAPWR